MTRRNSWLMCARSTVTGSWWAIREVCMRWASAYFPTCVWSTTTAGPTAPSSSTTASEFIFTSSVRSVRAAGESSRGGEESETRWRRKWEFELKELGRVGRAGITRPALMWFRVSVKCGTVYAVQRSEMFGVFMHFCHNVGEIGVNTHDVQIDALSESNELRERVWFWFLPHTSASGHDVQNFQAVICLMSEQQRGFLICVSVSRLSILCITLRRGGSVQIFLCSSDLPLSAFCLHIHQPKSSTTQTQPNTSSRVHLQHLPS